MLIFPTTRRCVVAVAYPCGAVHRCSTITKTHRQTRLVKPFRVPLLGGNQLTQMTCVRPSVDSTILCRCRTRQVQLLQKKSDWLTHTSTHSRNRYESSRGFNLGWRKGFWKFTRNKDFPRARPLVLGTACTLYLRRDFIAIVLVRQRNKIQGRSYEPTQPSHVLF